METLARSVLHDLHAGRGAVFRGQDGWEVVAHFGDSEREALAVRRGAGVSDLTHCGWLRLTGADRGRFLQAMTTNDVLARAPGQGTYAAVLNDRGRVVCDLVALVAEEAIYLDVEAPARRLLPLFFERFIVMDDVSVTDATLERALLSVQGPGAHEAVTRAVESDLGPLSLYDHREVGPFLVVRRDRVGEPGYEVHAPPGEAPILLARLCAAGAVPVGLDALETLRIEAGIPRAFVDMDESTLFLEAGLEQALSRSKGCFLGQEVVVRTLDQGGIKRRLCGLSLKSDFPPRRGAEVVLGSEAVGRITSSAWSPSLGRFLALAMLRRAAWEPGTQVLVEGIPANIERLPLVRGGHREKGVRA
jgi:folate-binding protein YgfZ